MADLAMLDRAYHSVMQRIMQSGQAPHYTELAFEMGLEIEDGQALLHDLIDSGTPAWLHPDTDYIVSFAPFHNLPTQYRITVDGEQMNGYEHSASSENPDRLYLSHFLVIPFISNALDTSESTRWRRKNRLGACELGFE